MTNRTHPLRPTPSPWQGRSSRLVQRQPCKPKRRRLVRSRRPRPPATLQIGDAGLSRKGRPRPPPGGRTEPRGKVTMSALLETHRGLLDAALDATRQRRPVPDFAVPATPIGITPKALQPLLDRPFELDGASGAARLGAEESPFGFALAITYPTAEASELQRRAEAARTGLARAGLALRTGIALETLVRLRAQAPLLAEALVHTTGAPASLAESSGVGSALQAALTATALAYEAQKRTPTSLLRPAVSDEPPRRLRFGYVPRGAALIRGTALQPIVTALPPLFANLVTANPTLVVPHPSAILPLALVVRVVRAVLAEAGIGPDAVQLGIETADTPLSRQLAALPAVRLVDHGGEAGFAAWLGANAPGTRGFAASSGVNPVVIDGTDDMDGLCHGLAYSLAAHSGQTPTRPQTLFVPADGIVTEQGHLSFEAVAAGLAQALDRLVAEPAAAIDLLGAIADPATLALFPRLQALGRIVAESRRLPVEGFAKARTATPLVLAVEATREAVYAPPQAGPIAFLVRTADTAESIERAAHGIAAHGAVLARVHSTNDHVVATAADAFTALGVSVGCNVTGAGEGFGEALDEAATWLDEGFVLDRMRLVAVHRPERG
ncbi:MAG: aldehyde dehydrogenase family protein [Geminicoccaceae bacterium]|nr:MAG: aldehyde dehydrogenase family protein [Geminicoccaceae bacterium]